MKIRNHRAVSASIYCLVCGHKLYLAGTMKAAHEVTRETRMEERYSGREEERGNEGEDLPNDRVNKQLRTFRFICGHLSVAPSLSSSSNQIRLGARGDGAFYLIGFRSRLLNFFFSFLSG